MAQHAAFSIGQIVHHRLFDYRGVIYDIDGNFQGSDEWYDAVAKSRPPRNRPWYRVLVDGQMTETYVAERNLEADDSDAPIAHPLLEYFFTGFCNGCFVPRHTSN